MKIHWIWYVFFWKCNLKHFIFFWRLSFNQIHFRTNNCFDSLKQLSIYVQKMMEQHLIRFSISPDFLCNVRWFHTLKQIILQMFHYDLLILDRFAMKITILFVICIIGNQIKGTIGLGSLPVQNLVGSNKVWSLAIFNHNTYRYICIRFLQWYTLNLF